jgi:hypothetical protein
VSLREPFWRALQNPDARFALLLSQVKSAANHPIQNQYLTNCQFFNSFALILLQKPGGMGQNAEPFSLARLGTKKMGAASS